MFRLIKQALYRARQFFQALSANLDEEDWQVLRENLNPEELAAFGRMSAADQRHSLEVYYTLVREGKTHPDLLKAALLHDIGKGGGDIHLWHRVGHSPNQSFLPHSLEMACRTRWLAPSLLHPLLPPNLRGRNG
jgi:hypothetical protein